MKGLGALLAWIRGFPWPSPQHWPGVGASLAVAALLLWWAGERPEGGVLDAALPGPARAGPRFCRATNGECSESGLFLLSLAAHWAEINGSTNSEPASGAPEHGRALGWANGRLAEGPREGAMARPPRRPGADRLNRLLRRVDRIPPSLALAQAAESAWGTSPLLGRSEFLGNGATPKGAALCLCYVLRGRSMKFASSGALPIPW